MSELTDEELNSIDAVAAIDCTWHQAPAMLRNMPQTGISFISLNKYKTTFWRYQHHTEECLATVEAIYYFYKEYTAELAKRHPNAPAVSSNIDDLLFIYNLQYLNMKQANIEKQKEGTISNKHKEYFSKMINN